MISCHIETLDPAFNLAFEEVLAGTVCKNKDGYLLFWRNSPAVIVGRFQNTSAEINTSFIEENNIAVIRRNSGGGAVYHDTGNLNFSFIIPRNAVGTGSLFTDFSFGSFLKPIIDAFADLGIKASLSGRNDILVEGAKCSGSAQFLTENTILHHGTILIDLDMAVLAKALSGSPDKFKSKGLPSVRSRVTNLRPYLPSGACMEDIIFAINKRCTLDNKLLSLKDMPKITDAAESLAEKKYRTWEWNYGRSPAFNEERSHRFPWGMLEMRLYVRNGIIEDCHFYGDFFSALSPELIARRICGLQNRSDNILAALEDAQLEDCFTGCDAKELRNFLAGKRSPKSIL